MCLRPAQVEGGQLATVAGEVGEAFEHSGEADDFPPLFGDLDEGCRHVGLANTDRELCDPYLVEFGCEPWQCGIEDALGEIKQFVARFLGSDVGTQQGVRVDLLAGSDLSFQAVDSVHVVLAFRAGLRVLHTAIGAWLYPVEKASICSDSEFSLGEAFSLVLINVFHQFEVAEGLLATLAGDARTIAGVFGVAAQDH